uniref:Hexosyltransferase n=1 Tax=Ciona savignyi TaxID=51511 RepID=H2Z5A9_CIOSA
MRRLKIISNVRPFLPVIIGLSLGFSMSIVRMPILHEDCVFRKDREYAPAVYDSLEDFEPRIITDPELKPKVDINLEANKKKIVRTRYISTELGIREKLVSSVITSRDTYLTMAVAMNKTFSHHMQKNILQIALDRLNEKYNPQGLVLEKRKLINGYRRFDPQRGMEYILDLLLTEVELSHRVNMLRPLSQVEIIPMPYVTESAKVHVILPLTKQERVYFEAFMDKYAKICLNNDENVALNIVFVYDPETAERIHQDDIFSEQKQLLQTYEEGKSDAKLIPWVSIKTEVPSQLKIMDIVAKKYPTDTLFLLASVAANMNTNFLNRCRMNAIPGWQAFFPIPFSQYNPEIIFKVSYNGQVPDQIDIKPNNGHFDLYSFDEVCIYNSDYMTSRTKMAASVSTEDSKESLVDTLEVYDVLIKYSQLHVFRAVEPHLTRRYVHRNCNHRNGQEIFDRCDRSNAEGLASRTQLAMELFPDEPKKN